RVAGIKDVVLGYDPEGDCFVGFDPQRLEHGGDTQNASAFIDREGLRLASENEILVIPRESELFDVEYHAIFKPDRLTEYLANHVSIHSGAYTGGGRFSGSYRRRPLPAQLPRVAAHAATGDAVILKAPSGRSRPRGIRHRD